MQHVFKPQAVAVGLASAFLVGLTTASFAETSAIPPSALVFDQKPQSGQVMVEFAHLPSDGYVVLYAAGTDGQPIREPIGHVELKAGDHRNISVKLSTAAQSGTQMWAALYTDKDGKPGFDKTADASIWNDDLPLENRFVIR
jgi:hypothetical protein